MRYHTDRRRFLTIAGIGATVGLTGCSGSFANDEGADESPESIAELPDSVGLETVVDGLDAPLAVEFAPDADRRYVAERDGRILVHESDGLLDEPFLDATDTVVTEGEQGLLGIALHPEFAENRRMFVRYSAEPRSDTPDDYSHTFVLAAFEATDDGARADPETERTILEIPQPTPVHNAGDLAFGPDGSLYVPVGDGGTSLAAQNVTDQLLGSVLRIDVDEASDDGDEDEDEGEGEGDDRAYAIPDDNPLVDHEGCDEYYAWGFRNPWRLSFDGDDLFVADVGQNSYEEVNRVEKGGNYGWNIKEGTHCFREDDCPDETDEALGEEEPLIDPIVEYPHVEESDGDAAITGISVIGGYVYRGSSLPTLEGTYVFGDFLPDGQLFVAVPPDGESDEDENEDKEDEGGADGGDNGNGQEPWPTTALEVDSGEKASRILGFGRDEDGEVYVLGTGADDGGVFRVAPDE